MIFPRNEKELNKAIKNKSAVVEIGIPSCANCEAVTPVLEKLEKEFSCLVFAKINANDFDSFCESRLIQSAPAFLFLCDGVELTRRCGAVSEKVLRQAIKDSFTV